MSVFKRGNKYWIGFRCNRIRYRQVSPENSYAGAKAYEAVIRQKLARGESLTPETAKKEDLIPSFQEFAKKWFEVYVKTNNKYSEVLNKECILRAHLIPFFGPKQLNKISGLDIETFKAKQIKAGLAPKTINNSLIVLSRCLRVAQEWEVIESVPRIKLLKVQDQKFDFLSEIECQDLINHCDGLIQDMIIVALKTGLRFGELIALEWGDINFQSKLMTVKQSMFKGVIGSTKSNRIRFVPLLDEVCEILLKRPKVSNFIFIRDTGDQLIPMWCLRWLHRACKEAGLRKIGWHTLRHTFASHLAQRGVSVTLIKELLGHSDIRTTMRYSHLTPSVTREAILLLTRNNGHNMATIPEAMIGELVLATPIIAY